MQTFAPYPDAARSAAVLDNQRVFKQTVETYQIILWLHGVQMWLYQDGEIERRILVPRDPTGPRYNHPAIRLWSGNERALGEYQKAFCAETERRGFQSTVLEKSLQVLDEVGLGDETYADPSWWGDDRVPKEGDPEGTAGFHFRHRSNLVFKNPLFYGSLFPDALPLRHEIASLDDLADYGNFYEYTWPTGRLPFKERKAENYAHTLAILGNHSRALDLKMDQFGWDTNSPGALAFKAEFAGMILSDADEALTRPGARFGDLMHHTPDWLTQQELPVWSQLRDSLRKGAAKLIMPSSVETVVSVLDARVGALSGEMSDEQLNRWRVSIIPHIVNEWHRMVGPALA